MEEGGCRDEEGWEEVGERIMAKRECLEENVEEIKCGEKVER